MNRENEVQQPVSQTFCGALQKEPNCKCLVLSVLIYGCLAAVTWCRCANVTKVVINFSKYLIKSTKHVSPCDDGYIYIPVAFMGMLYLVYLVECYHSPIRIDLSHAESQDCVLMKLNQLRLVQPTIWWKAVSYHYVRRKRQITRYRNGDNYTTTQVYYERVNTHAATSFYYYDYCGVKDISKELVPDQKVPITKIALTKGFAFSNMRSATEFEEARSRFFAEQELRDDYMEMREGLELGCNLNPTTLVAVLGKPWFTNRYVYWCLSALLLSWPLRVIIEYNTQYADYQVTKLFGVNYDTPIGAEPIRTSTSQLSQPGSYMLAPSYSEALLMEPAAQSNVENRQIETESVIESEIDMGIVPSYSEALLYERAELGSNVPGTFSSSIQQERKDLRVEIEPTCQCPCHKISNELENVQQTNLIADQVENRDSNYVTLDSTCAASSSSSSTCHNDISNDIEFVSCSCSQQSPYTCSNILDKSNNVNDVNYNNGRTMKKLVRPSRKFKRDISEPNLRLRSEVGQEGNSSSSTSKTSYKSFENILEEDTTTSSWNNVSRTKLDNPRNHFQTVIDEEIPPTITNESIDNNVNRESNNAESKGAIPKRFVEQQQSTSRCRVTVNPRSDEVRRKIPVSRTYFCLKSILKQNKRRYTLMTTAQELEHVEDWETVRLDRSFEELRSDNSHLECDRRNSESPQIVGSNEEKGRTTCLSRENLNKDKEHLQNSTIGKDKSSPTEQKYDYSRTLIFASPIQEVCPDDPFGGKNVVPTTRNQSYHSEENSSSNVPMLVKLRRSFTEREGIHRRHRDIRKIHRRRTFAVDADYSFPLVEPENYESSTTTTSGNVYVPGYKNGVSFPPYDGFNNVDRRTTLNITQPIVLKNDIRPTSNTEGSSSFVVKEHFNDDDDDDDDGDRENDEASGWSIENNIPSMKNNPSTLTRSLTERRNNTKDSRRSSNLRRSFTGRVDTINCKSINGKRTNLNMETSL
ncbi:PREDICTED: uncharacterized protein LOC107071063 [Polistes dominula]|uniref:Uncharacterized protein LOC107071063 n=1 Tax=Polistes dominula TaxID=743375 RepID=A0ABM1IYD9_POLDO|nr:PREDICTED: uncharacterized protein LOC107071063 [Polistes dominula]XP_015185225.1 PREDICTED: uncharacterized protein LOC107071063 [Polistes dominula]XP_015185226.1 PREDICTED: uncharacterized protein LOC107071063 [Polistes dominula]XP_015185227.1 PREDICTED: uncharacterized protein LOC107071063 [Polistes dominula]XP_015185228.1 PREDICTED: uncharacterized protein LOC107071063 [Polistes dominula]